eukprot:Nk52_evm38s2531 gene=Nk52_evmTU38s2531
MDKSSRTGQDLPSGLGVDDGNHFEPQSVGRRAVTNMGSHRSSSAEPPGSGVVNSYAKSKLGSPQRSGSVYKGSFSGGGVGMGAGVSASGSGSGIGGLNGSAAASGSVIRGINGNVFTVDVDKLNFENVALNDLSQLKILKIRNVYSKDIIIHLKSNLGGQLNFQLENENVVKGRALKGSECNEIFNTVNFVSEIKVKKGETAGLVIVFKPNSGYFKKQEENIVRNVSNLFEGADSYSSFEINGKVFLNATEVKKEGDEDMMANRNSGEVKKEDIAQTADIKFRANVCESVLSLDPADVYMAFDDCVQGNMYVKDFKVWNRSEIPVTFSINRKTASNNIVVLEFSEHNTGFPISTKTIPGLSYCRVRATCKAKCVGQSKLLVQIDNVDNCSNSEILTVYVNVSAEEQEECLQVSTTKLTFGNCFTSSETFQLVLLKNITGNNIDVAFVPDSKEVSVHVLGDMPYKMSVVEQDIESYNHVLNHTIPKKDFRRNETLRNVQASEINDENVVAAPAKELARLKENVDLNTKANRRASSVTSSVNSVKDAADEDHDFLKDIEGLIAREIRQGKNRTVQAMENRGIDSTKLSTKIEEIAIAPGKSKLVIVSYKPTMGSEGRSEMRLLRSKVTGDSSYADVMSDAKFTKMSRRTFLLRLRCSSHDDASPVLVEHRTISCKAKVCTSFIGLSTSEVNFGDCNLGVSHTAQVKVFNHSDMATSIKCNIRSKVVSTTRAVVTIPAKESYDLTISLCPRRVNPDYRKQITIKNLTNDDNELIVDIRSNNIDQKGVMFHSLFYSISTRKQFSSVGTGTLTDLDFEAAVVNNPSLKQFTIKNTSKGELGLSLSTSFENKEVKLYVRSEDLKRINPTDKTTPSLSAASNSQTRPPSAMSRTSDMKPNIKEMVLESIDRHSGITLEGNRKSSFNVGNSEDNRGDSFINLLAKSIGDGTQAEYLDLAASSSGPMFRRGSESYGSGAGVPTARIRSHSLAIPEASSILDVLNVDMLSHIEDRESVTSFYGGSEDNDMYSRNVRERGQDNKGRSDIGGKMLSLEDVIWFYEEAMLPTTFGDTALELDFINNFQMYKMALRNAIARERLVEVSSLTIPPEDKVHAYAVFTPALKEGVKPSGKLRKSEGKLFIKLLKFNANSVSAESCKLWNLEFDENGRVVVDSIPVREVTIRGRVCSSLMEFGQKNINFGPLSKAAQRTKSVNIINCSELPLVFRVTKTGSIASGDILINDDSKVGIVRPYGSKEIQFVFKPSLPGAFYETLNVENILDPSQSQTIHLKARVKKPATFFIQSLSIEFEPEIESEERSNPAAIILSNTSSKTRRYEMVADSSSCTSKYCKVVIFFELDDAADDIPHMLTEEVEEEIEKLEQKVKIAVRKGKEDKAELLKGKIESLKRGGDLKSTAVTGVRSALEAPTGSASESSVVVKGRNVSENASETDGSHSVLNAPAHQSHANSIIFELGPNKTLKVNTYLLPIEESDMPMTPGKTKPKVESIAGLIYVHEHKNKDVLKVVEYSAKIKLVSGDGGKNASTFTFPEAKELSRGESVGRLSSIHSTGSAASLHPMSLVNGTMSSPSNSRKNSLVEDTFVVSPVFFDLGTASLHGEVSYVVNICNISNEEMGFVILEKPIGLKNEGNAGGETRTDMFGHHGAGAGVVSSSGMMVPASTSSVKTKQYVLQFSESSGVIPAGGKLSVTVHIDVNTPGRQKHTFSVKHLKTGQEVYASVVLSSKRPEYISFPEQIQKDGSLNEAIMDFGECYIETVPRITKVLPLKIRSLWHEVMYLACESNLARQVFIFADTEMTEPAINVRVEPKSDVCVYVAIKPMELRDAKLEEVRKIVCGVKVKAFKITTDEDDGQPRRHDLIEKTVRLSASVGKSIIVSNRSIVKLGSTVKIGKSLDGSFTISNKSPVLKTQFRIRHPENMTMNITEGKLSPRDGSANSSVTINFVCVGSDYGLYQEKIDVINLKDPGNVNTVIVRFFVDDNLIHSNLPRGEKTAVRVLDFSSVYIVPDNGTNYDKDYRGGFAERAINNFEIAKEKKEGDQKWIVTSPYPNKGMFNAFASIKGKEKEVSLRDFNSNETGHFNFELEYTSDSVLPVSVVERMRMDAAGRFVKLRRNIRPFKTFVISNNKDQPLHVRTRSDLNIVADWCRDETELASRRAEAVKTFLERMDDEEADMESAKFREDGVIEIGSSDLSELDRDVPICGPDIVIPGKSSIIASVSYPIPRNLSKKKWSQIVEGKSVNVFGVLLLERVSDQNPATAKAQPVDIDDVESKRESNDFVQGSIIKIIELQCQFVVPLCSINPGVVDLGQIGYSTKWKLEVFEFTVENLSEMPVVYKFPSLPACVNLYSNTDSVFKPATLPEYVLDECGGDEVGRREKKKEKGLKGEEEEARCSDDKNNAMDGELMHFPQQEELYSCEVNESNLVSVSKYWTLEPGESQVFRGTVDPMKLNRAISGDMTLLLPLINCVNPTENVGLRVFCQLSVFNLHFSRLGDNDDIVLPALCFPSHTSARPCSEWFTVENISKSDELARFVVFVVLDEPFDELLSVEIVSRSSNAPLSQIALGHFEMLDVRVKVVFRLEKLKALLKYREELTRPEARFGKICFRSLNDYNAEDELPTETIDLRGTINIVKSFALSKNKLKMFTNSSWDWDFNEQNAVANNGNNTSSNMVEETASLTDHSIKITNSSDILPLSYGIHVKRIFEMPSTLEDVMDIEQVENLSCVDIAVEEILNVSEEKGQLEPSEATMIVFSVPEHCTLETSLCVLVTIGDLVSGFEQTVYLTLIPGGSNFRKRKMNNPVALKEHARVNSVQSSQPLLASPSILLEGGRESAAKAHDDLNDDGNPPVLLLHGASPLNDCFMLHAISEGNSNFEIDLNQVDESSGDIEWEISVENISTKNVEYRIYSIGERDHEWISISRTEGFLEGRKKKNDLPSSQSIHLTFSTSTVRSSLTYVVVESLTNPDDVKIIRIKMEVVVSEKVKNDFKYFELVAGGSSRLNTYDLGNVYDGVLYDSFSFLVKNCSDQQLEFVLSSNITEKDLSELAFAVGHQSSKICRSLTVAGHSKARVFVLLLPRFTSDNVLAKSISRKRIEIYVTCRLVKNYQQFLILTASCLKRELSFSTDEVAFKGSVPYLDTMRGKDSCATSAILSSGAGVASSFNIASVGGTGASHAGHDNNIDAAPVSTSNNNSSRNNNTSSSAAIDYTEVNVLITPHSRAIQVSCVADHECEFMVRCDSVFFQLSLSDGESRVIGSNCKSSITVQVNENAVEQRLNEVMKEKYIQEHFVIYNKRAPTEKYVVRMTLAFGSLQKFYTIPFSPEFSSFKILESRIIAFHKAFKTEVCLCHVCQGPLSAEQPNKAVECQSEWQTVEKELFLDYVYITDELIYFALVDSSDQFVFLLANIHFSLLFDHEVFKNKSPEILRKWVLHFELFLGLFPDMNNDCLSELRNRAKKMFVYM